MFNFLFYILFLTTFAAPCTPGFCQEEKIYTVSEVSVKPEPMIGLKEFLDKWSKRVKYPEEALKQKVQGMLFIEFIVNTDSSVVDTNVKRGLGHGCDEAALKAFNELSMEGWKPGIRLGLPVRVRMVLPFYYRIIGPGSDRKGKL